MNNKSFIKNGKFHIPEEELMKALRELDGEEYMEWFKGKYEEAQKEKAQ